MYAIPTTTVRRMSRRLHSGRLPETLQVAETRFAAATALELPRRMLEVIATALDMNPMSYALRTRTRLISDLRFVGALLLRQKFPNITLVEIGLLFGGQDHTTVLNGLRKASLYLQTGDAEFTGKYLVAARTVEHWMSTHHILPGTTNQHLIYQEYA